MSIRLSASFYKATIDKFALVKDDLLAFPILLSFLEKASQSRPLLQGAKDVVGDDEKFRSFYQKTRSSLPPALAQIVQKHEEEIREKLRPMIEAETRNESRAHELEKELKLRKEFEERLDHVRENMNAQILGTIIQTHLQTMTEIGVIKEKYDAAAKHDRIHKYIGYAVGVVGVAASVVGWPSLWQKIVGQPSDPPPLHVKLSSSGLCSPTDIRVEVGKDGTATLPSNGSVCLVVPDAVAPDSKKEPSTPFALPYGDPCAPFAGRSIFDILNDGHSVRLFKEDGSSICLHMPKITPDARANEPNVSAHKKQGKSHAAKRPTKAPSKQHQRKRCP